MSSGEEVKKIFKKKERKKLYAQFRISPFCLFVCLTFICGRGGGAGVGGLGGGGGGGAMEILVESEVTLGKMNITV